MKHARKQEIADKIHKAIVENERFQPLRGLDEPASLDEAYDIQDALYQRMCRLDERGGFGGHKIALTSPEIQAMCGVDQPAYGRIFAKTIHHSPHHPEVAGFGRIGAEFEVALEIGEDVPLDQAPFTAETIAGYVKSVMPALEMIDDRNADYTDLDAKSILTDRCWCGGVVLGKAVTDWRALDLGNLKSHVIWNGEIVMHGNTGNALGHPLNGLAWIANHLSARGGKLKALDVIMTGSALKTLFPKPGDECAYVIENLGEVSLKAV